MKDVRFICSNSSCRRVFSLHGVPDEDVGEITPELSEIDGHYVTCPLCATPRPELLEITNSVEVRTVRNVEPGDLLDINIPEGKDVFVRIHTRKSP